MSQWSPTIAKSYGQTGEQSHIAILHDLLLPLMQPLEGRTLLDFGCGEGLLGQRLASHGPPGAGVRRLLAIDQSGDLLKVARRNAEAAGGDFITQCEFQCGDETVLPTPERFDYVLCSLALMMCEDRRRLDRAIAGLIGSCQPDGRVLLTLTHPCFRHAVHATFYNDMPDDFEYWQSGRPYRVNLDPDTRQVTTSFHDYHWTLADYAAAIHAGGGAIEQMLEAPGQYDTSGRPIGEPAYLILCVKHESRGNERMTTIQ